MANRIADFAIRTAPLAIRYSLFASSFVAVDALAPLVPLLRLHRQRGDRARLEPLEGNRLAGLLAVAIGAVVETGERGVDLGDQLALAVAGAQLDRPVGFRGGAVGQIGMILVLG